ncbi:uncharacterized protein LOC135847594 [Planococcus citri]|uniref:uncharacterized protein LOC135847594 n=1 Tax=Planococcus citri TaxID=170843 RepID=UPI0031F8ED68
MVSCCSALGCKERATRGSTVTFHRFPRNPDSREKWIRAMKRKNFEPTKNSRLCEKHFTPECYIEFPRRKRLRENAVPVKFDFPAFVENVQPEQIRSIQFVDVDAVKNNSVPSLSNSRTVIVIDNVIRARRAEAPSSSCSSVSNSSLQNVKNVILVRRVETPSSSSSVNDPSLQNVNISFPVIKSCYSLSNSVPVVSKIPIAPAPRVPNLISDDCTQKRLINKTHQLKRKYKERLRVMDNVSKQLRKRKSFLENLLIRIKEKQLTSDDDVTDLMDCFVAEEEEEEDSCDSDEDSLANADEFEKTIAFIDSKISKFEKAVNDKNKNILPRETAECETFGLKVESTLNSMPEENASNARNQILEVLKKYKGKVLVKMYEEFKETFSGLENVEINED